MEWNTFGIDLLENIIGGIVAAIAFAGIVHLYQKDRRQKIKDLIIIMGQAVEHRNASNNIDHINPQEWITRAKEIETDAIKRANSISPAAGSMVEWLDQIDSYKHNDDVQKYIAILNKVIERIRWLLEKYV